MKAPNTANTPRSGMIPFDDDRDGLEDEDGLDDVNGDGHVTYMRRKNPNGRYKIDPENPKWLIRAEPDEAGQYEFLGTEGFDNDGALGREAQGHGAKGTWQPRAPAGRGSWGTSAPDRSERGWAGGPDRGPACASGR